MTSQNSTAARALLDLCSKHGYLRTVANRAADLTTNRSAERWYFGPLGAQLRRNIAQEWWKTVVTSEGSIYGLESPMMIGQSTDTENAYAVKDGETATPLHLRTCHRAGFMNGLKFTYDLVGRRFPFGMAQIGPCFSKPGAQTDQPIGDLFRLSEWTQLSMEYYSPSKTANMWMDQWTRSRVKWWKKFVGTSSNVTTRDFQTDDKSQLGTRIHFEFPWGQHCIEQISSQSNLPPDTAALFSQVADQSREEEVCVVQSASSLEGAMLAYLADAFHEKDRSDSQGNVVKRKVLHVHLKLAPYKVAIVYGSGEKTSELKVVAKYLNDKLRTSGVSTWDVPEPEKTDALTHFVQFDEMGIPFTVHLTSETINTGVLRLRHRDTTIENQLHINEVIGVIQKHLEAD